MRIPAVFGFIMKYISPTFLLIVVVGFCINNAPGYIETLFGDTEAAGDARKTWVLLLATIACIALLVFKGAKRGKQLGLDIDGREPLND